jgi:magnesium transporter
VPWYHFTNPSELDQVAERFHLHPLHVEDARNANERVKVEGAPHYTFALLKTLVLPEGASEPVFDTISIFASHAADHPTADKPEPDHEEETEPFFIVVADTAKKDVAAALRRAGQEPDVATPMRLLYLVFDSLVDSYFPTVDGLDDKIDALEDRVIRPSPDLLSEIFSVKRQLVDTRRLLVSTRDASMHLQRDGGVALTSEHQLYLRDLYDHISRLLDTIETQRDLLNNALDIYLSSIANRTNEVMKVLTVLSTVALPALVMTSVYGMNVKGLPFLGSNYAAEYVAGLTLVLTGCLLGLLRWLGWF